LVRDSILAKSGKNIDTQPLDVNGEVSFNSEHYNMQDLLALAVNKNASDIHISVGYPPVLRIDGELEEVGERIISPKDAEDLILSVLVDEKKELLEVNREVDFAYTYQGSTTARFRINAYYSMKNLSAAFRLIPSRVRTIEELMLPQMYHQFGKLKQGLVLVTGPTGHGKSTTLAAILEDINRTRFCHIVTIEDPVEYVFEGKKALIDQREMNDDTHSWEIALRSALRQDPDVILVGEMRDYETISSAITLAETGHLVFATLHTNSASQTIDRIIDVFPENQQQQVRTQLSNILAAVIAQRLIPLDKGGRRAVSEILLSNPAVSNLIREGKTNQVDNIIRTSSDIGMVSLERSLVNLVREGVINIQKAQEYAVYPEEVVRLLKA
jgi:twitching motility protein PilT